MDGAYCLITLNNNNVSALQEVHPHQDCRLLQQAWRLPLNSWVHRLRPHPPALLVIPARHRAYQGYPLG